VFPVRRRTVVAAVGNSLLLTLLIALMTSSGPASFSPATPGGLVRITLLVVWGSFITHAGWRCARALGRLEVDPTCSLLLPGARRYDPRHRIGYPPVLTLSTVAAPLACVLLAARGPVVDVVTAGVLAFVVAAAASQFGFVVAAAQVEAELLGEPAGGRALTLLHHAGGCFGIALARRTFPQSEGLKQFQPEFPWLGRLALGAAIATLVVNTCFPNALFNPFNLNAFRRSPEDTPTDRRVREWRTPPSGSSQPVLASGVPPNHR